MFENQGGYTSYLASILLPLPGSQKKAGITPPLLRLMRYADRWRVVSLHCPFPCQIVAQNYTFSNTCRTTLDIVVFCSIAVRSILLSRCNDMRTCKGCK